MCGGGSGYVHIITNKVTILSYLNENSLSVLLNFLEGK